MRPFSLWIAISSCMMSLLLSRLLESPTARLARGTAIPQFWSPRSEDRLKQLRDASRELKTLENEWRRKRPLDLPCHRRLHSE